jgi:ACS family hexuronate transporter-like MFS transporter
MFPKRAVASVTGLGGLAGSVGGMILMTSAGYVVQKTGSYTPLFVLCGTAHLLALAIFQALAPRMERVSLRPEKGV